MSVPHQPWCEMWLIQEGQVQLVQDEMTDNIRAGAVAILTGSRSRLSEENAGAPLSLTGFSCDARFWNALDFVALLNLPLRATLDSAAREAFENNLQQLLEECRTRDYLRTLAAHALTQTAFVRVLRAVFEGGDFEAYWRRNIPAALSPEIAGTLTFIASHFHERLDVERLARQAHLSPKHFARKFKTALKVAPMEFVRHTRLARAQSLLASSDDLVAQIDSQCGFDDAAHFSRAFKDYSGSTPLDFRRHAHAFTAAPFLQK